MVVDRYAANWSLLPEVAVVDTLMVEVEVFLLDLKKEMVQVVVLDYITQVVDLGHQHLQ